MIYGYARESAGSLTLEDQEARLKAAGCKRIFTEAYADSDNRPQLAKALQSLRFGDVLMVTSLDRLARSIASLMAVVETIVGVNAGIFSLAEPETDPASESGQQFMVFLRIIHNANNKMMTEKLNHGRKMAQKAGVAFGKPAKLSETMARQLYAEYKDTTRPVFMNELAKKYKISQSTVTRIVAKYDLLERDKNNH